MKNFLPVGFLFALGCMHRAPPSGYVPAPVDVVIVPGCPADAGGALSRCQWERVVWAAALYEDGVTTAFITSGGAVHNRYIEAESMAAGLVALGVPASRIHTETQALHSDENLAYGMTLAETLGYDRVGFATHDAHASVIRQILHAWDLGDTVELPMDEHRVRTRMAEGVPEVVVQPVPEHEWLPRNERERILARRHGDARLPSWVLYSTGAVLGPLMPGRPPSPPVPEPTLWGARHRVDTAAWP